MAKKAKKEIISPELEDLLGDSFHEEIKELKAEANEEIIHKGKVLLGYHPITEAEVWSK